MPTTDCATSDVALPCDPGLPDTAFAGGGDTAIRPPAAQHASKPLKGLIFGFAATVTVGLALASWYVGVRIVAAGQPGSSNPAPVAATVTRPTTPSAPGAFPVTQDPMAEAYRYSVPPIALYLQIASLGPKQDASFLRLLQSKGFRAHIQSDAGTKGADDARILVGPFSTHAEMEQAQRKLQSAGVVAIESAN
jgi:hypothetical protein